MKICVINPNTTADMTERIRLAAVRAARPDTLIVARNPEDGPVSIESHFDEAVSVIGVCEEVMEGARQGCDAYVVACFGDPGLNAARELVRAPVVGIAQAAFQMASLIATRFSVVTTLSRTCVIAEHLLHSYGYAHLCRRVRAAEVPVLDLERDPDLAYRLIVEEARKARDEDGIGAIVLGCAGMADLAPRIGEAIGLPVVEGVGAAVVLAESLVALGLRTSKTGDLAFPPPKHFSGRFAAFSQ
ncbi:MULTISPECIES: aspartate/glutamate racemase family protein [Chromobacterium]|uniref:aspartate/glutamate racemase family protein n=1 Tax=Chromobacterium TaxID=535 RepID=UPI001888B0AC|nr:MULTISPECIES: aspartate/glutamate racemase family protein [Chromobacterium]QOZ84932.1 aspartate/glutamate racemase family protein [Chromobacterium sp. Rain0013]WON85136.1 aspartate/glutamate racemase family protein [Chromobacterium haemolyticum]